MNYGVNAVRYEYRGNRFILAEGQFILNLIGEKEKGLVEENMFVLF
jgi:hypothetical protein